MPESRRRFSSLLSDSVALYAIQGLGYLFPLLLLPVLVRTIGPDQFGTLSLAMALGGYVQVVGDFGFGLTGSRHIALLRGQPEQIERAAWDITAAKFLLLVLATFSSLAVVWMVPSWKVDGAAFAIAILAAAGNSMFPTWLFQGMERMVPAAVVSVCSKFLNLALVLLLVSGPSDLHVALWISAGLGWGQTMIGYALACRHGRLRPRLPAVSSILSQYRSAWTVFLSQVGVLFYANTNILVLGFHCSRSEVASFSVAEKIVRAVSFLAAPIASALYPRVCNLLKNDPPAADALLGKIIGPGFAFFSALAILLVWQSTFFLGLINPVPTAESVLVLSILAVLPLSIFLDSIFGMQIVLGSGDDKSFAKVVLTSGLLALLLQNILIPPLGAVGAAASLLLAEVVLLLRFVRISRSKGRRVVPRLGI